MTKKKKNIIDTEAATGLSTSLLAPVCLWGSESVLSRSGRGFARFIRNSQRVQNASSEGFWVPFSRRT